MDRNIKHILIISLIILAACSTVAPAKKFQKDGSILFLNIELTAQNKTLNASISSSVLAEGMFKDHESRDDSLIPGFILIFIEDTNHNILRKIMRENPLTPSFENFSDSGKIERKTFEKKQGTLSLRIQYSEEFKYICIYKIGDDFSLSEIALLEIKME